MLVYENCIFEFFDESDYENEYYWSQVASSPSGDACTGITEIVGSAKYPGNVAFAFEESIRFIEFDGSSWEHVELWDVDFELGGCAPIKDITYDSERDRILIVSQCALDELLEDHTTVNLDPAISFWLYDGLEVIDLGTYDNGNPIDDMIQGLNDDIIGNRCRRLLELDDVWMETDTPVDGMVRYGTGIAYTQNYTIVSWADYAGQGVSGYYVYEPLSFHPYIIFDHDPCPQPGGSGNHCEADIYPNSGNGVWDYGSDGDCIVNMSDLGELLPNYGTTSGMTREDGDVYPVPGGDGVVNMSDLGELLAQYGDDCN